MARIRSKRSFQIILLIGLIMSLSSLWGCLPRIVSSQQEPDFDEIANRIVEAFEQDGIEPIKGILSQSALETSDLLLGIEYGHELLKDAENIVIDNDGGYEGNGWKDGRYYNWNCRYFNVLATNQVFKLSFQFFVKNTMQPEDQGLFRIYFATEDEDIEEARRFEESLDDSTSDLHWNYGATYERAGIYNPEWETTSPPEGYTGQRY